MSTIGVRLCPCGRPLHYPTAPTRAFMVREIRRFGPTVTIPTAHGAFRVPRHYFVLHGGFRQWEIDGHATHFGWRRVHGPRRMQRDAA
jgi:hypothetical protein